MPGKIDAYFIRIKGNWWYRLFSIFCRLSLAYAFIVAGMVKLVGERFASGLATNHPMGAYLDALHHTGYYYTFIGIVQVLAAVLLLIPRTVLIGAMLYLPVIVNIWILSFAVRFEGSIVTSPLMVLANLFLIFWHYDKIKPMLSMGSKSNPIELVKPEQYSKKFPVVFFVGVVATVAGIIGFAQYGFDVMPRNSMKDCQKQFEHTKNEVAGRTFCRCIHEEGGILNDCLEAYEKAKQN